MATLDLSFVAERGLVLHFGTKDASISTSTFANALLAFEAAAQSVATAHSLEYEFELVIEAVGPGSFRAWIREKGKTALFASVGPLAISLLAAQIHDRYFDAENVTLTDGFAVIENGDDRVVLPRDVYDRYNETTETEATDEAITKFVGTIQEDEQVQSFGISDDIKNPPPIEIPRSEFGRLASPPRRILEDTPKTRTVVKKHEVVGVVKAVFERVSLTPFSGHGELEDPRVMAPGRAA
ncbi:hypothetical protein ACWCOP_14170 [Maricaulaceae bacterium MS644]